MDKLVAAAEKDLKADKQNNYSYYATKEKTHVFVSHYFKSKQPSLRSCYRLKVVEGGECKYSQVKKLREIFLKGKNFLSDEILVSSSFSAREIKQLAREHKPGKKMSLNQLEKRIRSFNWLDYVTHYRLEQLDSKKLAIEHYLKKGIKAKLRPCPFERKSFSGLSDFIQYRTREHSQEMIFWEDKLGGRKVCEALGVPLPKLYQTARDVKDIDFSKLPPRYVIKWNKQNSSMGLFAMDNGYDWVTRKKVSVDEIKTTLKKLKRSPSRAPTGVSTRFTSFIEPQIIIEELLFHPSYKKKAKHSKSNVHKTPEVLPWDYKFYALNGEVYGLLCVDPFYRKDKFHFDKNWERITVFSKEPPLTTPTNKLPQKPESFDKMWEYASKIARVYKDAFVRIDFFDTPRGAVFGEFTFSPGVGSGGSWDRRANKELGRRAVEALGTDFSIN